MQIEESKLEELNELWKNYSYKDNEYPELSDDFQFSISEWSLLGRYASKPEILELFKDTYMEINALKEDADFIHYTPDIMDFDMFIEGDGTVVYDEKAYKKAVDDSEKFYEDFCKRRDKVDAVREQYPEEMKVLEKFFNAPEDCLREREKFFSELIHNKELLESLTSTHNENLEQNSGKIFKEGSSITEQKKNVLEVTPKHIIDEVLIVEDELDTLICNDQYLTELYAPNTENIICNSNELLLIIDAPNATTIECNDCQNLEEIRAPKCVKLTCESCDYLKEENVEVAYNCDIEGLKQQRGIKM